MISTAAILLFDQASIFNLVQVVPSSFSCQHLLLSSDKSTPVGYDRMTPSGVIRVRRISSFGLFPDVREDVEIKVEDKR
jgi:hypothetical protein